MRALARLFGLLRPYRLRLTCAIACMVVYSLTSTLWIALIQPFMSVLFRGSPSPASPAAVAAPGAAAATGGSWLAGVQRLLAGALGDLPPFAAFERLCVIILALFLLRNVADYTSRTLSWPFKLSALWASQAGSLLLWCWLLTGFSVVVVLTTLVLVFSAGFAWYTVLAMTLAAAFGRTVVPLLKYERKTNLPGRRPVHPIQLEWAEPGIKQGQ